jgi:MFS family permease
MWFLWFTTATSRTIVSPILPLLEDEFFIRHARAASIFIPWSLGTSLSVFFAGFWASLLGAKKAIFVSTAITALVFFFIPLIKTFELLYPCTFLLGVASGMYLPAMIPLLTDYYDEKIWGKVIAIHDSGAPISIFAAPLIALAILSFFSWRGIFVIIGMVLLMCAIAFWFVSEDRRLVSDKRYFPGGLWRRKELWCIGSVLIFMSGASMGLYNITPLYLVKELSMAPGEANTILSISRIGGVVVGISAGFFVDRFSLKRTMFSLTLATGLFTMLLALRHVGWIKVLLFVQASVVIGFFPAMFVSVSRLFEAEMRGRATGIILLIGAVFGSGLIPYLLGISGDLVGFRFGIFFLGVFTTLASGLLLFLKKLK